MQYFIEFSSPSRRIPPPRPGSAGNIRCFCRQQRCGQARCRNAGRARRRGRTPAKRACCRSPALWFANIPRAWCGFFYKIGQALRNFCRKALPFRRRQAACRPGGVYVCPKQNFVRIDIANSRNNALVQQTRFDGLFPFPQPGLQIPGVAPGRKRLWPQFANSAICIFFPEWYQPKAPEAARVGKAQLRPIAELQHNMRVPFHWAAGRRNKQAARHAQMQNDAAFLCQMKNQILAPAFHGQDGLARDGFAEFIRRRVRNHLRPQDGGFFNGKPRYLRLNHVFDCLNFRQFRHSLHRLFSPFF